MLSKCPDISILMKVNKMGFLFSSFIVRQHSTSCFLCYLEFNWTQQDWQYSKSEFSLLNITLCEYKIWISSFLKFWYNHNNQMLPFAFTKTISNGNIALCHTINLIKAQLGIQYNNLNHYHTLCCNHPSLL